MSEDITAVATPVVTEAEEPFGISLKSFVDSSVKPANESTPDAETQDQSDSPDTPADQTTHPKVGKSSKDKHGSQPRPINIEAKIKGLEKGFYKVTRELSDARRENQTLRAELKGEPLPDQLPNDTESIAARARSEALQSVSLQRAIEEFGEDFIKAQIFDEDAPYRRLVEGEGKKWIRERVLSSTDPIYEALDVIREHDLLTTYGRDIDTIRAILKEELKAEVLKDLKNPAFVTGAKPPTMSTARAAANTAPGATTNAPNLDGINPAFNLRAIA